MNSFKEIRERVGYNTQASLAKKIGTNRVNITRWETGARYPSPNMLLLLEKTLGVSAGEIIKAITAAKKETSAERAEEVTNES